MRRGCTFPTGEEALPQTLPRYFVLQALAVSSLVQPADGVFERSTFFIAHRHGWERQYPVSNEDMLWAAKNRAVCIADTDDGVKGTYTPAGLDMALLTRR